MSRALAATPAVLTTSHPNRVFRQEAKTIVIATVWPHLYLLPQFPALRLQIATTVPCHLAGTTHFHLRRLQHLHRRQNLRSDPFSAPRRSQAIVPAGMISMLAMLINVQATWAPNYPERTWLPIHPISRRCIAKGEEWHIWWILDGYQDVPPTKPWCLIIHWGEVGIQASVTHLLSKIHI